MATSVPFQSPWPALPKALFARLSDERLVGAAKRGHERAFEAIFDRYHGSLLAFCRHILGSREDAEDVLQHTFAAAFQALPHNDQPSHLKPWLYTIARNRAFTILRDRREEPVEEMEPGVTAGVAAEVEDRAEMRHVLRDIRELPEKQRTALLLFEASGLGHREIAEVLGCAPQQVRGYIFRARASLLASREARETPCPAIREQIERGATATCRSAVKHHIRHCTGCAQFLEETYEKRWAIGRAGSTCSRSATRASGTAARLTRRGGSTCLGRRRSDRLLGAPRNHNAAGPLEPPHRHRPRPPSRCSLRSPQAATECSSKVCDRRDRAAPSDEAPLV
jgi:RNA polymerase sigma factor (sigma-70 family)